MTSPLSFAAIGLASLLTLSVTAYEPAPAKADVSADGAHLLALASVGVTARMCKITLEAVIQAKLEVAMADYATRQQDFTQEQYDDELKRIASEIAADRNQICATIKNSGIEPLYQAAMDIDDYRRTAISTGYGGLALLP